MTEPWKRQEPTMVAKIGFRTIVSKTFVLPNGKQVNFQTWDAEGQHYAAVIAITTEGKVLTIPQFRVGPEQVFQELAGGFVDPGEEPEHAAARELEEETGYHAGTLKYLGKVYKDAYHNATWHYYLALDCVDTGKGQQLEDTEDGAVELITIQQLIDNAKNARMSDMEGVFLAYDELRELQKR